MSQLPLIDISGLFAQDPVNKRRLAKQLSTVFNEIGFVGIQGHGMPSSLIAMMRDQVMSFFALPMQSKLALQVQQRNYRGYIPLSFFTPNASKQEADHYEGYKLHFEVDERDDICQQSDLYGPNRWPAELPSLKNTVLTYWRHCDQLTRCLLEALAIDLELPASILDSSFEKPLNNMTLLHYPPSDSNTDGFGIHPHKDTDVLTILAPDEVGGLWLRPRHSKHWIDARVPADTLLVNVGDMLETWSGGYFQSTPHKVINSSGQERFSFPYFAVPRHDVMIEPLVATQQDRKFSSATAGEISRKIWHSNWPDAAPIEKQYDPYT
ncbi:MAG: isopenicillin N synthase-like dioxygenase [Cryomorphaceae bacterium]|jgi:isopenicillin N synthase-like dioxygenase